MSTEVLEELDFAQRTLGENLLAEYIGHLFNGNSFSALVVNGSTIKKSNRLATACNT